ncbi:uncharacterized protein LOC144439814 [Glandiceps talaboti]
MATHGTGYIMLSYHCDNKTIVELVQKKLQDKGYKVWMIENSDTTRDSYNTRNSAVNKASVVCLCISGKYKASTNCRLEGQHAVNEGKLIIPLIVEHTNLDGWVGDLKKGKTVYLLWEKNKFDDCIDRLDAEIKSHIPLKGQTSLPTSNPKGLSTAGVDEVCDWLETMKIGNQTINIFKQNSVTGADLNNMTCEDLMKDLEVKPFLAKKIIRLRDEDCSSSDVASGTTRTLSSRKIGKGISQDEERVLLDLSSQIGREFRSLGTYLGVPSPVMDRIKADNPMDMQIQIFKMLEYWRKNIQNPDDKYEMLCHALESCGRRDLSCDMSEVDW